jgi:hypothetical protein
VKSEPAERGEQADPRDGRRQHERELDDRHGDRVSREALRREQVRRRCPEGDDQQLRDHARLQADEERVADDGVRELVEQVARRRVGEDRDDRQRQEGERGHRPPDVEHGDREPANHSTSLPESV